MQNTMVVSGPARIVIGLSVPLVAAVAVPQVFHLLGVSGAVFLPIYTAVMLAALFARPLVAVITAAATPALNYLVSGMPATAPLPVMQILTAELLVLALVLTALRGRHPVLRLAAALIAARLTGLLFLPFHSRVTLDWWMGIQQTGLPGLLIQFAIGYAALLRFDGERQGLP